MSQNIFFQDTFTGFRKFIVNIFSFYIRVSPVEIGKGIIKRNIIKKLLPARPLVFTAISPTGAKINFEYQSDIGSGIYMTRKFFETNEISEFYRHIKNGVILDIGANIGIYTTSLGVATKNKNEIWCFEPVKSNVVMLKSNIDLNNLTNVKIYNTALGEFEGKIEINLSADSAYSSIKDLTRYKSSVTETVSIVPLDKIWAENKFPVIDAIKIDVEGAEIEVLKGALGLIEKNNPVILIEANDSEFLNKLVSFLEPLGYNYSQPKGFEKWNFLFVHK